MFKRQTKNFPPDGYHCVTIWPFLFYKGELTNEDIRHENVHQGQYLLCVLIGALILGIKSVLWGSVLNWIFIPLPFLLFYIIWGIGYVFKGYGNIFLEKWAAWREKK
jgi:hypothetical protein